MRSEDMAARPLNGRGRQFAARSRRRKGSRVERREDETGSSERRATQASGGTTSESRANGKERRRGQVLSLLGIAETNGGRGALKPQSWRSVRLERKSERREGRNAHLLAGLMRSAAGARRTRQQRRRRVVAEPDDGERRSINARNTPHPGGGGTSDAGTLAALWILRRTGSGEPEDVDGERAAGNGGTQRRCTGGGERAVGIGLRAHGGRGVGLASSQGRRLRTADAGRERRFDASGVCRRGRRRGGICEDRCGRGRRAEKEEERRAASSTLHGRQCDGIAARLVLGHLRRPARSERKEKKRKKKTLSTTRWQAAAGIDMARQFGECGRVENLNSCRLQDAAGCSSSHWRRTKTCETRKKKMKKKESGTSPRAAPSTVPCGAAVASAAQYDMYAGAGPRRQVRRRRANGNPHAADRCGTWRSCALPQRCCVRCVCARANCVSIRRYSGSFCAQPCAGHAPLPIVLSAAATRRAQRGGR